MNTDVKLKMLQSLLSAEARRDFYTGVIKEIKNLVQFDPTPNFHLKEAKWELYKITLPLNSQFHLAYASDLKMFDELGIEIQKQRPSYHRVLFQNANGNINMGVCFNDPELEVYDFTWFTTLRLEMETAFNKNEGLILMDEEFNTCSCFVELQRNLVLKTLVINV